MNITVTFFVILAYAAANIWLGWTLHKNKYDDTKEEIYKNMIEPIVDDIYKRATEDALKAFAEALELYQQQENQQENPEDKN